MNQIGKEAYKQATRREKHQNEMRKTKKDIHDFKNALYCTKLALDYLTEHEKPLIIIKSMDLQNKENNLLVKFNAVESSNNKIDEEMVQQEHSIVHREDRIQENNTTETQGVVGITESDIDQQVV